MGNHEMSEMMHESELKHSSGEAQGVRRWILEHGQEIYIAKCFVEGFIYAVVFLYLITHW